VKTKLKVLDERTSPWYAEGLSFACTQCGNCCTGGPGLVWISDIEIGRLAEFMKISREQVVEKYCRTIDGKFSFTERRTREGNYDCIFLREEKAQRKEGDETIVHTKRICSIYPVRPLQCRTWPFWEGNLGSEAVWKIAGQRCPGMDRGKKYSREEIEGIRDAEDWE
jgi:hypothetical protein